MTLNKRKTIGTGLAGPGRPAGSRNRTTTEVREALADLVVGNVPRLREWLDRVAKHNPKAAADLWLRMAEFVAPKLARVSVEHSADPQTITVCWKQPTDD
jgi:hypothetical protein